MSFIVKYTPIHDRPKELEVVFSLQHGAQVNKMYFSKFKDAFIWIHYICVKNGAKIVDGTTMEVTTELSFSDWFLKVAFVKFDETMATIALENEIGELHFYYFDNMEVGKLYFKIHMETFCESETGELTPAPEDFSMMTL